MKNTILGTIILSAALGLAACEQEGPFEQVGEQIDDASEQLQDGFADARNEIEDACENVKDDLDVENKNC